MREAFVCINASPDSIEEVFEELRACKEVQEVFRVHGVYDIIARVNGETFEELSDVISRRIRSLGEVQSVLSMLMIESKNPVQNDELLLV